MKRQGGKKSTELIPGVEDEVLVGLLGFLAGAALTYVAIKRPELAARALELFTRPPAPPAPPARPRLLH